MSSSKDCRDCRKVSRPNLHARLPPASLRTTRRSPQMLLPPCLPRCTPKVSPWIPILPKSQLLPRSGRLTGLVQQPSVWLICHCLCRRRRHCSNCATRSHVCLSAGIDRSDLRWKRVWGRLPKVNIHDVRALVADLTAKDGHVPSRCAVVLCDQQKDEAQTYTPLSHGRSPVPPYLSYQGSSAHNP